MVESKLMLTNGIYKLYFDLFQKFGPVHRFWPQWCCWQKTSRMRELIALGAILTQRTSWRNSEIALENLKKEGLLSIEKIASLSDLNKLTDLIRPAGFYTTKPGRIHGLCQFITNEYGTIGNFRKEELEVARQKLLKLSGIGQETADTILLYALDKQTFVIDEYTKRLVKREKLSKTFDYESLQRLFEKNLPCDVRIYQDFHALIIIEQKGEKGSMMKEI